MIKTLLIYLPFIISYLMGALLLNLILKKETSLSFFLKTILSLGLGLGISSYLTFSNFLFLSQYSAMYLISLHLLVLGILIIMNILRCIRSKTPLFNFPVLHGKELLLSIGLILISLPFWSQSHFYAHGGWDAWAVWNLKAKFLFLGGDNWKAMLDPLLWRSSPHYPLFLPLLNVWGWSMIQEPNPKVPVFTAFLFTFLTASLIFAGIKKLTNSYFGLLAAVFLLTFPYFTKLALSQYSDIIVGFYLLLSIVCLTIGKSENNPPFYLLAGMFLGFLSFSKNEGLMASVLLLFLTIPYLLAKNSSPSKTQNFFSLGMGALLTFIPSAIFYIVYAPDNQTFINGLTSPTHPMTWERLRIIFSFYLIEFGGTPIMYLMQLKTVESLWNTTWVILVVGLLLGWKKTFHRDIVIIPLFLMAYGLVVTFYYMLNTYFEIAWWLQVTLHRIAFSTLPTVIFWVFYSLFKEETPPQS